MTTLLDQAIAEVQKLPPDQQDAVATIILEELEDEKRWDRAFANSQDALARLAEKARADILAGKTKKLGFDEL
jgi:hypothetical protein